jgi:hypothetical protein
MREPGRCERGRRGELVVRTLERDRRVQHAEPESVEQVEVGEPRLDSVDRRTHIETAERGIARLELDRLLGRAQEASNALRRRGREAEVRLRCAMRDDRDPHAVNVRPRHPTRGVGAVNEW